ncbi:MAG: dipeptide/oligopeptide/nickel ABC transporter ATP-binding protein [Chloroflexi bacterium]|nr:MAG: dipeptide/oligopeptide/nickel ABC transporter ATP-binding protein [Chloroflexota bacterium]
MIAQSTLPSRDTRTVDAPLLEVKGLQTHFFLEEGVVKAVDGVDFQLERGKTLAIVGESGCGKSVMARTILQIVPEPGKIVGGEILFHRQHPAKNGRSATGEVINITALKPDSHQMRELRGKEAAMIFQEPMTSLSPVHTIGNQIMENFLLHFPVSKQEARNVTIEMLQKVGIPRAEQRVDAYPHQLSGGMRQRAMIAMALICQPSLLIADEPTTALDVTTQAQILEVMKNLQRELGMAVMIITHDLGVVAEVADDVVVMYLGQVVEHAPVDELFHDPKHPYTRGLLRSIPKLESETRGRLDAIPGSVPHPYNRPNACVFHPRCKERVENKLRICKIEEPQLLPVDADQSVRCWLYHDQPARDYRAPCRDEVSPTAQKVAVETLRQVPHEGSL